MDFLKGYRTFAVNGLVLATLLITALTGQITDPAILRGMAIGLTVVNVLLRFFTDSAPGKSA